MSLLLGRFIVRPRRGDIPVWEWNYYDPFGRLGHERELLMARQFPTCDRGAPTFSLTPSPALRIQPDQLGHVLHLEVH